MINLPNEMLQAIIAETVDSMPSELLAYYRNPPGRMPDAHVLRIQAAIVDMDDATAEAFIRDIVDRVAFQMLYLVSAEFKDRGITTIISRGPEAAILAGSLLHEVYRKQIDPGGRRVEG